MLLTPNAIRQRKFTTVLFKQGYDEREVDTFLDEVEEEVSRLRRRIEELEFELVVTRQKDLNGFDEPQGSDTSTLSFRGLCDDSTAQGAASQAEECCSVKVLRLAQQTADQAISESRAAADQIVDEAERYAARVRQEAQSSAYVMERRTSDLREFERECRNRLKAYLQSQLHQLGYYEANDVASSRFQSERAQESTSGTAWIG